MSGGEPLPIVPSWARAIGYRPSLCHRLSLAYLVMRPEWTIPKLFTLQVNHERLNSVS